VKRQPICLEAYPPTITIQSGHIAQCYAAVPIDA
jgi:hypothetical protein